MSEPMSTTRRPQPHEPALDAARLVVERVRLHLDRAEQQAAGTPLEAAAAEAQQRALDAVARRLAGREGETRRRLLQLFALSPEEADALDCAVAVAVEPALGPRLAALQGLPQAWLPTCVALRLLFGHGTAPMPRAGSPLRSWHLVTLPPGRPGEPPMIEADPGIVEWYAGLPSLAGADGLSLRKLPACEPPPEWEVTTLAARVRAAMQPGLPVRVTVRGESGSGRSSLAAAMAQALGLRPLAVQAAPGSLNADAVLRLQRLALLMGGVAPIWRGDPLAWPQPGLLAPLQFITLDAEDSLPRLDGAVDLPLPVPPLDSATRSRLAQRLLPASLAAALSPLGAPRLSDLRDAAAAGLADAAALHAFLRERSRERVQGVGHIVQATYGWNDLVLPAPTLALLRALEAEARHREQLLADTERRRLFEGTAALTALFAGPPGTGKSMAAQVVAAALQLDLLVIDTGAISSKFIGETAKNLSRAFAVAREANCAILFDEADALFARRVEADSVNARYANADTGHLLQLVESHRHLVMLSTNRRADIDPAFLRRLRFIVDFTLPDQAERSALWTRMLGVLGVPEGEIEALAEPAAAAHTLSGAQIKSAALSAAFAAQADGGGRLDVDHVRAGIRRELAKEGRIGELLTPLTGARMHRG